ncbi:MAG: D-glucuronyl C5-epimerase family protein [Actinomycetaceae bacterium]
MLAPIWPIVDGHEFRGGRHELVEIDTLPYNSNVVDDIDTATVDDDGMHLYVRHDTRYVHPVGQAQFALSMLSNWQVTGDAHYLEMAEANAEGLLEYASDETGPLWFSYEFDFPLHGDASNTIHGPWWSAMAQGQVLSLMSRLAAATNAPAWHEAAERVFLTFLDVHGADELPLTEPWAVFVQEDGWLWLEEYAGDVAPMRVLNGHIFAMYGLYDYWALTGNEEAAMLFDGAAETVLEFVPDLRNMGEPSWYGMRIQDNPRAQSESYHRIHVHQLEMVGQMTGDERFTELSEQLRSDFY